MQEKQDLRCTQGTLGYLEGRGHEEVGDYSLVVGRRLKTGSLGM